MDIKGEVYPDKWDGMTRVQTQLDCCDLSCQRMQLNTDAIYISAAGVDSSLQLSSSCQARRYDMLFPGPSRLKLTFLQHPVCVPVLLHNDGFCNGCITKRGCINHQMCPIMSVPRVRRRKTRHTYLLGNLSAGSVSQTCLGLGFSDKKIIPRKTEQTEQMVTSDGIPVVPRNRKTRNSVPNPSEEEKITRNSVPWNQNRSKLP